MMLKKIEGSKPTDGSGTNAACAWGTQFEPVAKHLYCVLNGGGGTVVDTSCVSHPVHGFLGASPDGIYMPENRADPRWGKLIEFKCPISRQFDASTPIPDAYYHQMQLQMECCNIDECDYVEMRFAVVPQKEWMASESPHKGRLAVYEEDAHVDYDWDGHPEWRVRLKQKEGEYKVVHWVLAQWRMVPVKRDYTWMETHIEDLTAFWNEVTEHRRNGTIPTKDQIVRCELQIDRLDAPLALPSAAPESQEKSSCSLSVRKKNAKTLQFDLASSGPETQEPQTAPASTQ
jgi:hypothetical protein